MLFRALVAVAIAAFAFPGVASAQWHEARSKHFVIYADQSPEELRRYAEKLERFDAAVREARGTPDVTSGTATRVTLFLVRDLRELRRIYGDEEASVAGFYIPRASGSVAFVPEQSGHSGKFELSSESIFFHEYTHHLMLQDADRPLPSWLTEGFAEFFANPRFNPDGSVVIGAPPTYRAEALYTIWRLPLAKMLSGDYQHLTGMEWESIYGRGWLLTHLLSFDLERRGQLTRYLDAIAAGVPAGKAAEDAFGDLKKLDKELNAYFKKDVFTVATIPAEKLRLPPIEVRPLTPGEAKTMGIRIQLARGGGKLRAGDLAGRARKVAEAHPEDPSVLTLLAQAEYAAGNHQAASEAADRALRIEPNSVQALLAKGKAMLDLAKASPATADWAAIRAHIVKANKADPENAEPLALFHRTYVAQGVRPPKNALDGLVYAVALAPQDSELRMELIGQLIDENRMSDAGRVVTPLAYSPHRGKWRDAAIGLLQEIVAGDRDEAKKKWQAALKYFDDK